MPESMSHPMDSSFEPSNQELCFIDASIKSLHDVPLPKQLKSINLHSNAIEEITNLGHLSGLRHLDLSSNRLRRMTGLESLTSLRTLNLSSNFITLVEGLMTLRNLQKIYLSYNNIEDLSGFRECGAEHELQYVELQGNRVSSLHHVTECFRRCSRLTHLVLQQGSCDNPVCKVDLYGQTLWTALPQLDYLDGYNKQGVPDQGDNIDVPGLDEFLDYLVSNESGNSGSDNVISLATPAIDEALEKFRQRGATTPEVSTTDHDVSTDNHKSPSPPVKQSDHRLSVDHEVRLEKLEHQLAQVLYDSKASGDSRKKVPTRLVPKRDVDPTDESETENTPPHGAKARRSKIPSYRRPKVSVRVQRHPPTKSAQSTSKSSAEDGQSMSALSKQRSRSPKQQSPRRPSTRQPSPRRPTIVTSVKQDEELRDDIKSTYVQLLKELESERERRWKAEQAAKKLVDHISELKTKVQEEHEMQQVSIKAMSRLKQALTNEREAKLRLQDDCTKFKDDLEEVKKRHKGSVDTEENQKKAMRALEETAAKMEAERVKQQAHEARKLQDAQARAAASKREVEILQSTIKTLEGQVQQLQELLANREQDHRKQLENRYDLNSKELQEVIARQVCQAEQGHKQRAELQLEKYNTLHKQYGELEEEFRMALRIEANRLNQVQEAFEKVSEDNAQNKHALLAAYKKDEKSSALITELTAMVKEQKNRIAELSRSKSEQVTEYKKTTEKLESQLEGTRRQLMQMEVLKQDKIRLESQVQAQESVIEGLKAERKLWGHELAQQGASLAQDRGRMEAKIESLTTEVQSLEKQLEREADTVKIKAKIIDDQTDTVRKLKEGLLERDEQIKQVREELLSVQKDYESQLSSETNVNQELQEQCDRLTQRKVELKDKVSELEEQLEETKRAHGIINNKWKEKSGLIGTLEQQVLQMKETWDKKEKQLTEERDKALQAGSAAVDRLRSVDDNFRKQLDQKERAHQEALTRLESDKQAEIDQANIRIIEVEDEMRELLKETQVTKRNMEERIKKLTKGFSELHQDLIS